MVIMLATARVSYQCFRGNYFIVCCSTQMKQQNLQKKHFGNNQKKILQDM